MSKKNEIDGMEFLGKHMGYQLYRNSEGNIEGYKSIGLQNTDSYSRPAKDLKRFVTHAKTIAEFLAVVAAKEKTKKPKISYDPYKDEKQTKLDVL
jgi:hypothetical protein